MYYTYDDVLLLAGELVGLASSDQTERGFALDLCLQAGKLRGMVAAGEPINSDFMADEIDFAFSLYAIGRRRDDTAAVA